MRKVLFMKGSELRLIEYMEGSKKRFIIPVYQRNYDWKIENCKQLYDDLIQVIKNNSKTHFFGSIVSVYEPSGRNTEFLIIDGQQRLTTMSCSSGTSLKQVIIFMISPVSRIRNHLRWKVKMA